MALDDSSEGALASLTVVVVVAEGKASPRAGLGAALVGPVAALVALSSSVVAGPVPLLARA